MEAKKSDDILPDFGRNMVSTIKYSSGIIIGLLIIYLLLSVMTGLFCTVGNLSSIMRRISINVILACGMTMVIILRGIDLSVDSVIAVSECLCCRLITNVGVPSAITIPISICTRTLVGALNELVISRATIPPLTVTLAMMSIGWEFARVYTKATTILVDDPLFAFIGSGKILGGVPAQFVYMLVVIVTSGLILNGTRFGRNIYAVGGNKQAASYSGINFRRVTMTVFVIMGTFASCAGILSSTRTFSTRFNVGKGPEMDAISAVVLGGISINGGIGCLSGTIIDCIIIGVLNDGMNILGIDPSWQYVVKDVMVLIAVFIDYIKKVKD